MASEGPRSAGTGVADNFSGNPDWTNAGNIVSSNDSYATCVLSSQLSDVLTASSFGFSIPGGSVIAGIKFEVEGKVSAGTLAVQAELIDIGGTQDASFTTTEQYHEFGGATNLWGRTPTVAQINSSAFGIYFFSVSSYTGTMSVDHVRCTIYYTEALTTKPFRRALLGVGF